MSVGCCVLYLFIRKNLVAYSHTASLFDYNLPAYTVMFVYAHVSFTYLYLDAHLCGGACIPVCLEKPVITVSYSVSLENNITIYLFCWIGDQCNMKHLLESNKSALYRHS